MSEAKRFTNATGAPVPDNTNIMTVGPRGPASLQNIWLIEKLAHFDREVIPERRMHAKGWGAYGTFTVTHDITRFTRAKIFSAVGGQTPMFVRFSTVAGERGAADAQRDIRGTALKFYTEEGNWDIVGNNTPVFFFRDPVPDQSLNAPVHDESADQWQDHMRDESESCETVLADREEFAMRKARLAKVFHVPNEREYQIVTERWLKEDPTTLEELAPRYSVSRERIRQLEVRALVKVPKAMRVPAPPRPKAAVVPAARAGAYA